MRNNRPAHRPACAQRGAWRRRTDRPAHGWLRDALVVRGDPRTPDGQTRALEHLILDVAETRAQVRWEVIPPLGAYLLLSAGVGDAGDARVFLRNDGDAPARITAQMSVAQRVVLDRVIRLGPGAQAVLDGVTQCLDAQQSAYLELLTSTRTVAVAAARRPAR